MKKTSNKFPLKLGLSKKEILSLQKSNIQKKLHSFTGNIYKILSIV